MGQTSRKLHDKLSKMAAPLDLPTGKVKGRADVPSIERWIKEGMDPVHAAYAFVQHLTSRFAEGTSQLAELKAYATIVGAAEEEYMPSASPMSPLTASFSRPGRFTTCASTAPTPSPCARSRWGDRSDRCGTTPGPCRE